MKAWSRPLKRKVGHLSTVIWAWEPEEMWTGNCSDGSTRLGETAEGVIAETGGMCFTFHLAEEG